MRDVLSIIGNVLWFLLGGLLMGVAWWLVGVVAFVSIVGIPWGRACFVLGRFHLWPFGRKAISRSDLTGRQDLGTGPAGTVGNVIWFVFAGWWLAIGHLLSALASFVTIIGIPFAFQHVKFAGIAVAPIGKTIVRYDVGGSRSRTLAAS